MNFLSLLNNFTTFLATMTPPPPFGDSAATAAADVTADVVDAVADTAGGGDLFSVIWPIIMWGGIAVLLYFFMYRQPKKEMKKKQALRAGIKVGDNIITNAGLFGKVVEIGTDSFIIEFGTNRGVRVPILKESVEGVREPRLEPPMIESK